MTKVRLEAVGSEMRLFLNEVLDNKIILVSRTRYSGSATLYVSDPWHYPAAASVSSIVMTALVPPPPPPSPPLPAVAEAPPTVPVPSPPPAQPAIQRKVFISNTASPIFSESSPPPPPQSNPSTNQPIPQFASLQNVGPIAVTTDVSDVPAVENAVSAPPGPEPAPAVFDNPTSSPPQPQATATPFLSNNKSSAGSFWNLEQLKSVQGVLVFACTLLMCIAISGFGYWKFVVVAKRDQRVKVTNLHAMNIL